MTLTPKRLSPGFNSMQSTATFSLDVVPMHMTIVGLAPKMGPRTGGTDLRITVTGLYVHQGDPLPEVTFGSVPATSVSVVTSDVGATILNVRTPPAESIGVVTVFVEEAANSTFGYISAGVTASCARSSCEVDAIKGSSVIMRIAGIPTIRASTLTCTIDEKVVSVSSITPAGLALYDVILDVPGTGEAFEQPLSPAAISIVVSTATVYGNIQYRSPPRMATAEFSSDGSRIFLMFDQPTDGFSSVNCSDVLKEDQKGSLGNNPTCTWDAEGKTLEVMLGSGVFISLSDRLHLIAGKVRSLNGVSSPNVEHYVTVEAPVLVIPPV